MRLKKLYGNHIVDEDRLDENSMVIDAGACKGEVIEDFPVKCHFIAIEPDKRNFEDLRQLQKNSFVFSQTLEIVNAALVGKKRIVDFYEVPHRPEWGSIDRRNGGFLVYQIEGITLDDYPKADYIKMDIEGTELEVIQNLSYKPPQMSIECHDNKKEVIKELKKQGYNIKKHPHDEVYAFIS